MRRHDGDALVETRDVFAKPGSALLGQLLSKHPDFVFNTSQHSKVSAVFRDLQKKSLRDCVEELKSTESGLLAQNFLLCCSRTPKSQPHHRKLLELLQSPQVERQVVTLAVFASRALLNLESISSSSSERSLLKHLGSWIGWLTLSKNKPLLFKDLDLKCVLTESVRNGRMIAAVPFVTKILECCACSKIFRVPNPWLTAVLSLLAELHGMDVVLNIKFEVEMLFKVLQVDLQDLRATKVLGALLVLHEREEDSDWNGMLTPDSCSSATTPLQEPLDAQIDSELELESSDLSLAFGGSLWHERLGPVSGLELWELEEKLVQVRQDLRKIKNRVRQLGKYETKRLSGEGGEEHLRKMDVALVKARQRFVETRRVKKMLLREYKSRHFAAGAGAEESDSYVENALLSDRFRSPSTPAIDPKKGAVGFHGINIDSNAILPRPDPPRPLEPLFLVSLAESTPPRANFNATSPPFIQSPAVASVPTTNPNKTPNPLLPLPPQYHSPPHPLPAHTLHFAPFMPPPPLYPPYAFYRPLPQFRGRAFNSQTLPLPNPSLAPPPPSNVYFQRSPPNNGAPPPFVWVRE